jgi:hypothetical protein
MAAEDMFDDEFCGGLSCHLYLAVNEVSQLEMAVHKDKNVVVLRGRYTNKSIDIDSHCPASS